MTNKNLMYAMGYIDSMLIAEAAPDVMPRTAQKKSANKTWVKWGAAVAACLALVLGIGIPLGFHFSPDDTIVDELYPFDSIRVGESTGFANGYGNGDVSGYVSYDTLEDTSLTFTITVNEANEYGHYLILNYYVEFEINGEMVADGGERINAYPLLDVYVNGEKLDKYDFAFLREAGTYQVTVDFTRLLEAEGRAVLCDFVFPGLVAFEVYHFEE